MIAAIETVVQWLAKNQPALDYEVAKGRVWITTDLSPKHPRCRCADCVALAGVRISLLDMGGTNGGFRWSLWNHRLPSGKRSQWVHLCECPVELNKNAAIGA